MNTTPVFDEVKKHALLRMHANTPRIEKCLEQLSEEQVWARPNAALSSMGNLILHLCGNITQYIQSSIGHQHDNRVRDEEFAATGGLTRQQLIQRLQQVVQAAAQIIQTATTEELMRERSVQGYTYTGIGNIIHVVEHYSYHTGQIAFWTKYLNNKDLGFYAGMDLNKKNQP